MNRRDLGVHLQNHWAAAAGGVDFARRVAETHRGSAVGPRLDDIHTQVVEDREALREIMVGAGVRPGLVLPLAARVGERLGRFKPNGHVVRRSPVSDLLELEGLRSAVTAKAAGWETMLVLAEHDERLPGERLSALAERGHGQAAALAAVQHEVATAHATS